MSSNPTAFRTQVGIGEDKHHQYKSEPQSAGFDAEQIKIQQR